MEFIEDNQICQWAEERGLRCGDGLLAGRPVQGRRATNL
jgi:hypothetical protein